MNKMWELTDVELIKEKNELERLMPEMDMGDTLFQLLKERVHALRYELRKRFTERKLCK